MSGVIPSPMTPKRLKAFRRRAERGEPLSRAEDQVENIEAMRPQATIARKVQKADGRCDDDGDAVEIEGLWTWCDRYLASPIGSVAALAALAQWKRAWAK